VDVGVNDGSCGVVWYQLVYILLNFTIRYRFEGFIDGFKASAAQGIFRSRWGAGDGGKGLREGLRRWKVAAVAEIGRLFVSLITCCWHFGGAKTFTLRRHLSAYFCLFLLISAYFSHFCLFCPFLTFSDLF
jgi:hypothetical protein